LLEGTTPLAAMVRWFAATSQWLGAKTVLKRITTSVRTSFSCPPSGTRRCSLNFIKSSSFKCRSQRLASTHLILRMPLLRMSATCQRPVAFGTPMMPRKNSSFMAPSTSLSQW